MRNNRQCSYTKKHKPGPKPGSGQDLVDKIDRLESVVQILSEQLANHICDHNSEEPASRKSVSAQASPNLLENNAGLPVSSIEGTSEPWLPQIEPSAQSQPRRNVQDTTPKCFNDSGLRAFTPVTPPSSTSLHTTIGWPSQIVEPELPPPQELYVLVDLYFKHINTWIPMLDRVTTFSILSQPWTPAEPDRALLHAIVTVSLRFSRDPGHTAEVQENYREFSKRRVQLCALEHSNIRTVQALVLLSVDMLGCSHRPETSNMIALITQSILNFRLGLETTHRTNRTNVSTTGVARSFLLPPPKSWTENEERRRLFWVVYSMDRYSTLGTSSRFAIEERAAKRRLPCRYDMFSGDRPVETRWPRWDDTHCHFEEDTLQNTVNLGSYSYHCELLKIITQTHEFLRTPLQIGSQIEVDQWKCRYSELDSWLSTWLSSLPGEYSEISQFCHSDTKSKISNWIILQAAFVVAVIQLHGPAAYPPKSSKFFRPSYNAMQKCLGAVVSLKELTQDVVDTDMLDLLGPGFAFALWSATRLLLIHASIKGHTLNANIFFFMDTLAQLGQYWPIARKYWEMLDAVTRGHGDSGEFEDVSRPSIPERVSRMRKYAVSLVD